MRVRFRVTPEKELASEMRMGYMHKQLTALMAERDDCRWNDDPVEYGVSGVEGSTVHHKDAPSSVARAERLVTRVSKSGIVNAQNDTMTNVSIVGLTGVSLAIHPGSLQAGQACDGLGVMIVAILWSGKYASQTPSPVLPYLVYG